MRSSSRGARSGPAVASVTVPVPADLDLSAAVLAARRADDRFFCFEQPDRDGYAVCGLGAAAVVEARGDGALRGGRAGLPRDRGPHVVGGDPATDPSGRRALGPVFVGGFAFAPDGRRGPGVVLARAGCSS